MRKITLLLSFIACVAFTQAQSLLVENFDYTPATDLLGQGSWALTATAASPNIQVTASSITYPAYPGSGVGNEVTLTNGQDLNKAFAPQTTGSVYASFLVNVSAISKNGDYFLNFGAETIGTNYVGRVFVKTEADASSKIAFGIQMISGGTIVPTYSAFDYSLNTTYLIVLKHDNSGKVSSIIINPNMSTEPTSGWLNDSQGTSTLPANIGSVALRQPSPSAGLNLKLDGIRVAKSWVDLFTTSNVNNPNANKFTAVVSGKNLLLKGVQEGAAVEIFSAIGSRVLSATVNNGKIDMSTLSKGLYVVRVNKETQKIIF